MIDPVIAIERKRQAIKNLVGDAPSFAMRDETIINWDDPRPQPSESDIQVEVDKLKAEYDRLEYSRKRKEEFPTIEELVVALYDTDDKADIEKRRAEVKAKYPKE